MTEYSLNLTGVQIDAALNAALLLPSPVLSLAGKLLRVNEDGDGFDTTTGGFPSGTTMLAVQPAAPIGWTKKSDWGDGENRTILVGNVFGSGGSTSPITFDPDVVVDDHALHSHSGDDHYHTTPNHIHDTIVPADGWTGAATQPSGRLGYSTGAANLDSGLTASRTLTSVSGGTGQTGYNSAGSVGVGGPTVHGVTNQVHSPKYQIVIAIIKN